MRPNGTPELSHEKHGAGRQPGRRPRRRPKTRRNAGPEFITASVHQLGCPATDNGQSCDPAIQQSSNPAIQQSSNPAIQQSSNQ
jgi:hypothetical protein